MIVDPTDKKKTAMIEDLEDLAKVLRREPKFAGLQVVVDMGDPETHLPFLVLRRPNGDLIAVVAETYDRGLQCCNVAQNSPFTVTTVAEVIEHCTDALTDRKRLDAWPKGD